jgi:hypothetical protein
MSDTDETDTETREMSQLGDEARGGRPAIWGERGGPCEKGACCQIRVALEERETWLAVYRHLTGSMGLIPDLARRGADEAVEEQRKAIGQWPVADAGVGGPMAQMGREHRLTQYRCAAMIGRLAAGHEANPDDIERRAHAMLAAEREPERRVQSPELAPLSPVKA